MDYHWMVYVDGSFVWRYNEPDHSSSGAGAYIAQLGQVVAYEHLGLGSYIRKMFSNYLPYIALCSSSGLRVPRV